jgi:hypothetical protein
VFSGFLRRGSKGLQTEVYHRSRRSCNRGFEKKQVCNCRSSSILCLLVEMSSVSLEQTLSVFLRCEDSKKGRSLMKSMCLNRALKTTTVPHSDL